MATTALKTNLTLLVSIAVVMCVNIDLSLFLQRSTINCLTCLAQGSTSFGPSYVFT